MYHSVSRTRSQSVPEIAGDFISLEEWKSTLPITPTKSSSSGWRSKERHASDVKTIIISPPGGVATTSIPAGEGKMPRPLPATPSQERTRADLTESFGLSSETANSMAHSSLSEHVENTQHDQSRIPRTPVIPPQSKDVMTMMESSNPGLKDSVNTFVGLDDNWAEEEYQPDLTSAASSRTAQPRSIITPRTPTAQEGQRPQHFPLTHNSKYQNSPAPVDGRKQVGDWMIGKTIGEGSSGKVKLATHRLTGQQCVVKAVRRPRKPSSMSSPSQIAHPSPKTRQDPQTEVTGVNDDDDQQDSVQKFHKRELYMIREAVIGMSLYHPNIVHLNSAYLGQNHFYCFFDYMEGEDLVDYITRNGRLKEKKARVIFRSLISAVEFTHRNHIVHRDLKLENIRFDEKLNTTKLLDFGFATYYREVSFLQTNCGSPCYAAPEIYDHKHYKGPEIDVWSLGICLYGMVTGGLPFDGPSFTILAQRVKRCEIYYPPYLSIEIKHLLSRMLVAKPEDRAALHEIMQHVWVNTGFDRIPMEMDKYVGSYRLDAEFLDKVMEMDVCSAGRELMGLMKEIQSQQAPSAMIESSTAAPMPITHKPISRHVSFSAGNGIPPLPPPSPASKKASNSLPQQHAPVVEKSTKANYRTASGNNWLHRMFRKSSRNVIGDKYDTHSRADDREEDEDNDNASIFFARGASSQQARLALASAVKSRKAFSLFAKPSQVDSLARTFKQQARSAGALKQRHRLGWLSRWGSGF